MASFLNLFNFNSSKYRKNFLEAFPFLYGLLLFLIFSLIKIFPRLKFGNLQKFVDDCKQRPNKKCLIKNSSIFKSILNGKILFESLYTGYLAKLE